ncbi:hypothetical protein DXT99_06655 [Pontibacter diazotrophicus]|uniref:STAS/SEC14 domain-containing protein n=1 Tax=Pontibacter diazotrophicus TaxID=1400979 RepID=A0A3D8LF20_9BACT|nr:hypothetical protein [Pontibacter diazotrophicus]RDV16041.1 hypothetical protein DXT99_06655 [Pontibacter diazotrophicus]
MGKSVLVRNTLMLPDNILEVEKINFRLWIDFDVKLMYTEWILKPSAEEYQEVCNLCVKLIRRHAVECWIADSKLLTGFPTQVQQPILHQVALSLLGCSLKKIARIIEKDSESIIMFENISSSLKERHISDIEVEQFITFEDAADWIGMIRG